MFGEEDWDFSVMLLVLITTFQLSICPSVAQIEVDAEIAELDMARPENAAPDQTEVLEHSGAEYRRRTYLC